MVKHGGNAAGVVVSVSQKPSFQEAKGTVCLLGGPVDVKTHESVFCISTPTYLEEVVYSRVWAFSV